MADAINVASMDIKVMQSGDNLYTVSGKDALKLHEKMRTSPPPGNNLEVGELKDGTFTLRKMAAPQPAAAAAAG